MDVERAGRGSDLRTEHLTANPFCGTDRNVRPTVTSCVNFSTTGLSAFVCYGRGARRSRLRSEDGTPHGESILRDGQECPSYSNFMRELLNAWIVGVCLLWTCSAPVAAPI